jgi:hypothetical protein
MTAKERAGAFVSEAKRRRKRARRASFVLALALASGAATARAQVLDRLVVAVNDLSFTQRQVEAYIVLKESMRKTADGRTRVVDEGNWRDALTVFSEDMVVLGEVERLGGAQPPSPLVEKYLATLRERAAPGSALAQTLTRLGVGGDTLRLTVESVLKVAIFRRTKARQTTTHEDKPKAAGGAAKSDADGVDLDAKTPERPRWLEELEGRALVRRYRDAERYVAISPSAL